MADRLTKKEALNHWKGLKENLPLKPTAIPYKQTGSTYGQCGLRIDGTREFIDSVLARLKPLTEFESDETRIGLNYQQIEPRDGSAPDENNWVCYVKFYERGPLSRKA